MANIQPGQQLRPDPNDMAVVYFMPDLAPSNWGGWWYIIQADAQDPESRSRVWPEW